MSRYRKLFYAALAFIAVIIGVVAGIVLVHMSNLPEISSLEEYKPSTTTRIFDCNGELLAEFYMENRIPVPLSQVPPHVRQAFIATEDPRFYHHSGIDISGIIRAAYQNLRAGRVVQGGSTITQQLAKQLFLDSEKTLSRKVREALLALQIERRYSKDEILSIYLNQVYLGSGAYGVEAAANRYFGKSVGELTLGEAAVLGGLPAAPNKYSPVNNLNRCYQRRQHVLQRMLDEGYITRQEMDAANAEPITVQPARAMDAKAPYFVEYVRQKLEDKYGETELYRGGLNVYTTLDLRMQEMADAAMAKGLAAVDKRHPRKDRVIQGALIAIDPHSGEIKAMVGGRDYKKSVFNRSVQALRQPGSSFKAFVYATAVEKGMTPEDTMVDEPVSYPGAKPGVPWRPVNFENKFEGTVTLRRALAESINVVAVKLLQQVGIQDTIATARKMGLTTVLQPYLPLALGASDVTLLEMTSAYSVFDNGGVYTSPQVIEKVTDREGGVIEDNVPTTRQAISANTAAIMTDMLTGVVKFGTASEAGHELNRPAAGKTGTTSEYDDAWFIGYLPSTVTGVWVGYDDHKPIGNRETGARAALPIWLDFIQSYVKEYQVPPEDFPKPTFGNMSGVQVKQDYGVQAGYSVAPVDEAPAGH